MPADPEPPELARLVDFAERSREGDWSLRSALVRYAQANPVRVSRLMEHVRRIEAALHPHAKVLASRGPDVWAALADGQEPRGEPDRTLVGVLAAAAILDDLGDRLAEWALDRNGPRPDAEVDAAIEEVGGRLDALGVARESRERPPAARRRG